MLPVSDHASLRVIHPVGNASCKNAPNGLGYSLREGATSPCLALLRSPWPTRQFRQDNYVLSGT